MRFSGYNSLVLPQTLGLSFTFSNIIVRDNSNIAFGVITTTGSYQNNLSNLLLFKLNSGFVYDNTGLIVSTYNIAEPFSLSGWIDNNVGTLISVNGIDSYTKNFSGLNRRISSLTISGNNTNLLTTDILIHQPTINRTFNVSDFFAGKITTGILASNYDEFILQGQPFCYQSYESLLGTGPIIARINSNENLNLLFNDGDISYQENRVYGYLDITNASEKFQLDFQAYRKIDTNTGVWSFNDYNESGRGFGSQFFGSWSNNKFTFQDNQSVVTWNYMLNRTDALGNPLEKFVTIDVRLKPSTGNDSVYITGFRLTSSGEYLQPPTLKSTGYYHITGITQAFQSMLFSSGCSGDIPVTFKPIGFGAGASGKLLTSRLQIQDLYTPGLATYYLVSDYQMLSSGSGYSAAPIAVVNSGMYGNSCYDVPKKFGYNVAWFLPVNTFGTMDPDAAFLTGVPLMTTGLISGGALTGYFVTGVDLYNQGSGYNTTTRLPYISFIRQSGDILSKNASGQFLQQNITKNQTQYDNARLIETRIGNREWITGSLNQIYLNPEENTISIRLTLTGLDTTLSVPTWALLQGFDYQGQTIPRIQSSGFGVFTHWFDSGEMSLKKNYSVVTGTVYPPGSLMNFLMTQDELDSLYSSSSYLNNNVGLDLGDLNF